MSYRPPAGAAVRQTAPELRGVHHRGGRATRLPAAARPRRRRASRATRSATGRSGQRRWPCCSCCSSQALKLLRRRRRSRVVPVSARFVGGWDEILDLSARSRPRGARSAWLAPSRLADWGSRSSWRGRPTSTCSRARNPPRRTPVTFWRAVAEERRRLARDAGVVRRAWSVWAPRSSAGRIQERRRGDGVEQAGRVSLACVLAPPRPERERGASPDRRRPERHPGAGAGQRVEGQLRQAGRLHPTQVGDEHGRAEAGGQGCGRPIGSTGRPGVPRPSERVPPTCRRRRPGRGRSTRRRVARRR